MKFLISSYVALEYQFKNCVVGVLLTCGPVVKISILASWLEWVSLSTELILVEDKGMYSCFRVLFLSGIVAGYYYTSLVSNAYLLDS